MAYVEYEADGKTIKARVWQKVDTLANWEANSLVIGPGEQAFVIDGAGTPINFKIGDGTKKFSELPWWISYDQGQYVQVVGNALPTPTVELGYSFVGPGTYTHAGGDVVAPDGRFSQIVYEGGTWSLKDMGALPGVPKTTVVGQGITDVPESDAVWRSLDKRFVNKGKAYPYVNQPAVLSANVIKLNKVILDVVVDETTHSTTLEYSVTLIARNATSGNWGNGIHIRVLNNSDFSQTTSVSFKSTDTSLDADTLAQLAKIAKGGLQTISLKSDSLGRTFHITIDSDELVDGDLVDAQYSDLSNHMFLAGSTFNKVRVIPSTTNLATKQEVTDATTPLSTWQNGADRFLVNKGKAYPMINYPTIAAQATKVNNLKNILLEAELYDASDLFTYYIGGFYKDNPTFGSGIILMRRNKATNAIGGVWLTTLGNGSGNIDQSTKDQLALWSGGGVQTVKFTLTIDTFAIKEFTLVIDTSAITSNYIAIGYQDDANWGNSDFNKLAYKKQASSTASNQIASYSTFKQSLQAGKTGLIKVGSLMAESIVDSVSFSGNTTSYYPSQIWGQYRSLNKNTAEPKRLSEIMTVKTETGAAATIKSFGKRFIYFGTASLIYRTQDELKNKINTHLNTSYEKLILPEPMPNSSRATANAIMGVYEMDNGELLIEVKNGIKENEADDYRGHRTQVYVTNGLKNVVPTVNANNIPEYNLSGIVTKVHEYKAWTNTQGKVGTTVSIVGNKIALSPYYIGRVGLVHYSNDYGVTWRVIFNMGVDDAIFSVPYKGSTGAWPLPSNLNPVMPEDMWTAGGNTNYHVHGVTIDSYMDGRIWVSTGDSGSNYQGRTALWYSDDEGITWTRIQTKGVGVLDSYAGLQPMGVVCTKDYILAGSDSATDGLYRWSRTKKSERPALEPAWWYENQYNALLRVIFGGAIVTREGYVYSVFHPNTPDYYNKGVVVFTGDGVEFNEVYYDEVSDGTSTGVRNIDWGSWIGQDRYGNVYVANANGTVIKLF